MLSGPTGPAGPEPHVDARPELDLELLGARGDRSGADVQALSVAQPDPHCRRGPAPVNKSTPANA
jgi:hypothetical protein